MYSYLQPEDDGLSMCPFGPWVTEKLDYLERYINIFETSMRNKWYKRHYIDLFAGSGKCVVSDTGTIHLGSPLLALTTRYPFTDYFFVDSDSDNISTLEKRCSNSPVNDRIQYFVGDANHIVRDIVDLILTTDRKYSTRGKRSSLNLAFLDPYGLELRWETVATLAQPYRMDLIIHYPQNGLDRNMRQLFKSEKQTAIDLFFGDTEWRKIYGKWQHKQTHIGIHRLLMDHYKEKLQDLGYKQTLRDDEVGYEPLMRNARRNAPLYRLLFASKHELGLDFWQKVNRRNVHGQMRLF